MLKYKIAAIGSAVVGLLGAFAAGATIITPPDYSAVMTASSTAFGSSLFTDLLPWAGLIIIVVIVGMLAAKIVSLITRAAGKLFKGRRGGRRRGRR